MYDINYRSEVKWQSIYDLTVSYRESTIAHKTPAFLRRKGDWSVKHERLTALGSQTQSWWNIPLIICFLIAVKWNAACDVTNFGRHLAPNGKLWSSTIVITVSKPLYQRNYCNYEKKSNSWNVEFGGYSSRYHSSCTHHLRELQPIQKPGNFLSDNSPRVFEILWPIPKGATSYQDRGERFSSPTLSTVTA